MESGTLADWLEHSFGWMAWTWVTGTFFLTILGLLVVMTVRELAMPTVQRKGFLPISTTRGDRFFIGLLSSAFIHLAWLGLVGAGLTWALAICAAWMVVLLRYG